jgi:hypothetical protein
MQITENIDVARIKWDCQYQPHRLYSLWDMISFLADELMGVLSGFDSHIRSCDDAVSRFGAGSELPDEERGLISKLMDRVENVCRKLGLDKSEDRRRVIWLRTVGLAESPACQNQVIASELKELQRSLEVELAEKQLAFIPDEKVRFFEQHDLFGEAVSAAFPSAQAEIKDAGNCLAADLNTAAVFHLMRAAEHGLRTFARHLKVRVKGSLEYADWGAVLNRIDAKLTALERKLRGKKKSEELEFFRLIESECNMLKDVWRNNVMHTRGRYTAKQAEGVFERVRDFMQRLSQRVKESK